MDYVIVYDSDGVFTDFHGFMREKGLRNSDKHFWAEMSKFPNLFYNLKMLPDALDLYAATKHLKHYVLTAMPRPTGYFKTSVVDKQRWWAEKVHPAIDVVVVTSGKLKAAHAAPNKVLIDDLPRNIKMWEDAGGIGILHTSAAETISALKQLGIID